MLDHLPESADTGFSIKDCALIAIATGRRASSLTELKDRLATISEDSVYFHFWGGLIQPRFEEREFNNDFAAWVRHKIHDGALAERLAVVDPTDFANLKALRRELIELIEQRLDEAEYLAWIRANERFEFIRSQIVVFDTHRRMERPEELVSVIPHLSVSSVFYHFIDARRRVPGGGDDLSFWISGFGPAYSELCRRLAAIDPYFVPLTDLRRQLVTIFHGFFGEASR